LDGDEKPKVTESITLIIPDVKTDVIILGFPCNVKREYYHGISRPGCIVNGVIFIENLI
jgi:hypothetical protein